MILNGPMLIFAPKETWLTVITSHKRTAPWILTAALTASILPAVSVVAGHFGSLVLGYEESALAMQRAAIGMVAIIGGALVTALVLTLILSWISDAARVSSHTSVTGPVAMGIVWPAWTTGVILAFPPLFGLGPELGELAWIALASLISLHVIRKGAVPGMGIRRRWSGRFVLQTTVILPLIFGLITVAPAIAMRSAMGISSKISHAPPEVISLPLPSKPDW